MSYITEYFCRFSSEGAAALAAVLPVYLLFRAICLDKRRQQCLYQKINACAETAGVLLFSYLIMLFVQTFSDNGGVNEIRLVPFQIISGQIAHRNDGTLFYREFIYNILGNTAVFVPVGFLTAYLCGGRFGKTVLSGLWLSLLIETVQLPLNRTSDVDDLILNTAGAVIGWVVYRLLRLVFKKAAANHKEKKQQE